MIGDEHRQLLRALFFEAIKAAAPLDAIKAHLPQKPKGRTVVVGAGKAAAQMALALETCWDGPLEGVVVDRHGISGQTRSIEVINAAHPVPDEDGLSASRRLLEAVSGLSADDLVIALISGGGSALLPAPAGELSFADEVAVNKALLASGAPISAMNVVRKHVSAIKGGRLAKAAAPARVVSLLVSDVAGDNPATIASGPTVPDGTDWRDALAIVEDFHIVLPETVMTHLRSPQSHAPLPSDPAFSGNEIHVIASARLSLMAAKRKAEELGWSAAILSDAVEGEASDIAGMHAAMVRNIVQNDQPFKKPFVMFSGGETTVTLRDGRHGKGGRNSEFLLAFAKGIEGVEGVYALSADTDGIDGSEDNAGAFADGQSFARMRAAGVDPVRLLRDHDAWTAFDAVGDLFVTGPTGTNVNDFRAVVIAQDG